MKSWINKTKIHWQDKSFLIMLFTSLLFLLLSFVVNFYAGTYASEKASQSVTDIVLSNTRAYDVDGIFIYGPFILWIFVAAFTIYEPKRIPFTLKSIALFLVVRSVFISLTHIGPFPGDPTGAIVQGSALIKRFTFGADLFFSAHTGLPYLMALTFWDHVFMRWALVITSIFFGIVVLLGHYHYSIDVLSAFFITYSIFHIALHIFKKDRELFMRP
ncbi:MAG: phosphatase PAP2-related protein [bacterium]